MGRVKDVLNSKGFDEVGRDIFGINDSLTREQTAVFVAKLFNLPIEPTPSTPTFRDVSRANPNYAYIEAFARAGITSGCGAGIFCPTNTVTRGEFAVFIARAVGLDTTTVAPTPYFTDVPTTHAFFKYVQAVKSAGLFSGCSETSFCVNSPTTKSTAAIITKKILSRKNN